MQVWGGSRGPGVTGSAIVPGLRGCKTPQEAVATLHLPGALVPTLLPPGLVSAPCHVSVLSVCVSQAGSQLTTWA